MKYTDVEEPCIEELDRMRQIVVDFKDNVEEQKNKLEENIIGSRIGDNIIDDFKEIIKEIKQTIDNIEDLSGSDGSTCGPSNGLKSGEDYE